MFFISSCTQILRDKSSIVKAVYNYSDQNSDTAFELFEKSTAEIDALVCSIDLN